MGLAVSAVARDPQARLPHLTAEYAGHGVFAQRYFKALAAQLAAPFVLVFDNYQDVPANAMLHAVLSEGIAALPQGFRTVVLSRTPPPIEHASLQTSRAFMLLGWDEMQLTAEEVEGIERLRKRSLRGDGSRWAAGLVLLLEQDSAGPSPQALPDSSPQLLFDHFAAEIFAGLDGQTQNVLLASAVLPKFTAAMLAELTDVSWAGRVLEALHRKNYFTVKHGQASGTYEYHPLFRDFLLRRARSALPPAQLQALRRKAAALAQADGQLETAANLLAACGDFAGIARQVMEHARGLIEQGRGKVVEGWLSSIPAEMRATNPWLCYWHGICRLPFNPAEARAHFEQAYTRFKEQRDFAGSCLAWCAIVDSFVFEWGNFKPLRRWLAEMQEQLDEQTASSAPELDAAIACGMFLGLMYAEPQHPHMRRWERCVREIVLQGLHPALYAKVGNHLLIYYTWWTGDLRSAGLLVDALRGRMRQPGVPPLLQITWDAMAAGFYWMSAANGDCIACVEHGLEVGRTTGVHTWDMLLLSQGVFGSLSADDLETARRYLDRMEMAQNMSRPMDRAMCYYFSAWYRFAQGNARGALPFAEKAVAMAEEAGATFPAAVLRNDLGRVLCYLGETARGAALIRRARVEGHAMNSSSLEYLTLLAEAEVALEAHDEAAGLQHLRRALAVGRAQQFRNHTWWSSKIMARLYAKALAHGIEEDYVAAVMRTRGLVPFPDPTPSRVAPERRAAPK